MKHVTRLLIMGMVLLGIWVAAWAQEAALPPNETNATAELQPLPPSDQNTDQYELVTTLSAKLRSGGITVVVQVLFSIGGLAFAIERFIKLRRGTIAPPRLYREIDTLWSAGRVEEVQSLCKRNRSTLARVVTALIEHRHSSPTEAAAVAGDIGARELRLHLQKAYPIAVVATIEPLLGLFGTVLGMILAFDKVALMGAMGNAAVLSSEISLALVTTAVGLAIAIPMLILHHYFKSRTSILGITLEEQVNELISRHMIRPRSGEVSHAH